MFLLSLKECVWNINDCGSKQNFFGAIKQQIIYVKNSFQKHDCKIYVFDEKWMPYCVSVIVCENVLQNLYVTDVNLSF